MYENDMYKTMIDFNKTVFNNGYEAMIAAQEQSENFMNSYMKNNEFIPKEGQKTVDYWVGIYKEGQKEFKKMMDKGFETFEGLFDNQPKVEKKAAGKKK